MKLDASLKKAVDESIQEFGFNIVASDRVSLDRAPKDLRADEYEKFIVNRYIIRGISAACCSS